MLSFLKANARWIAGGFLLTFFSSFGQTFFIGLSGQEIRTRFDLSDGDFGLMYMAATLASALTLPFLGRLVDIMPAHRVVMLIVPPLAAACVLFANAPSFALALLAVYMLRLFGQGMMTHIALTQTGRWFEAARGRATSLIVPGHQAGEALLPIAFVIVSAWLGWQAAWNIAAALLLVIALPVIASLYAREREPEPARPSAGPTRTARDWTRSEVVADPMFYALLTGVLAPAFIGTTIFFHQDYLVNLRGFDPLAFASAFPLMALTTAGFALIAGYCIDRFGAIAMLPYFLIPLAIASAAAALMTQVWSVYVFMCLLGVSYGFSSSLFGALWPEVYGVRHLGSIRSMIVAAMVFGTAIGPGLTGYLIDNGVGLPAQLLWMSGWCIAGCAVMAIAARTLTQRSMQV